MHWLRLLNQVRARTPSERLLLGEAAVSLVAAWVVVRCVPFKWWSRWLGSRDVDSVFAADGGELAPIRSSIAAVASQLPSTCLMDALAGKWMLNRRDIPNTLYFGVRTASAAERADTNMFAHAWLCAGTAFVAGEAGAADFSVIVKFTSGQR